MTFWPLSSSFFIDAFWWLRTKQAIFARKIVNFSLFYKIKTTSLKISCIKHLHSSFCTHFDAFWRIFSHSEHLEQNVENPIFLSKMTKFFSMCSECINMQQNVFRMNSANVLCMKLPKKWFLLHLNWLKCIIMHSNASKCMQNELF